MKSNLHIITALSLLVAISAPSQVRAQTPTDTAPSKAEEKSAETKSVQPQVDEKVTDEAKEKRKKILEDAVTAIDETKNALKLLDEEKTDEALAALEKVTGKLELILARDPKLALAPVNTEVVTYDLLASPEAVRAAIRQAEDHLEDGEIQKARPLVANLASEIVYRTTNIPLATYPEAIKAIAPLIDAGKLEEAKTSLQLALNTLVVTSDAVIPLPVLRAENLLKKAEKLAENKERKVKDNDTLAAQLKAVREQLKMGELLGYGDEEAFKPMYEQLEKIEQQTSGGKAGKGWFDEIKDLVSGLF